jgi:hypothetical protein
MAARPPTGVARGSGTSLASAALLLALAASPAVAGHEDDRPPPPPQTLLLGVGPAAPRLEVRHDAAIGSFEVRVVPRGEREPVLVEPTLTYAAVRFPLARVEGKEQVWKVVDPRLAVAPLPATFEAKIDERTYSVAFGGHARVASKPVASRRPRAADAGDEASAPPPTKIGPEGGRLLPLGEGSVLAEAMHDPAARRLTIVLRDRKDGSLVPVVSSALTPPPVAYVLLPDGRATRVPLEPVQTRPDLATVVKWDRTPRWTAVSDAFAHAPLEGRLRVRVADAAMEANLGSIDAGRLDPPIEERMTLHGGRLVVFGEGAFHGELVHDRAAGTLHVWLQDPKDKTPIPVADPPVAEVEHRGKILVVDFAPVRLRPRTNRADEWLATHEVLKDPAPLRGRLVVRVTDRPYSAWLSPDLGTRGGRLVPLVGAGGKDVGRIEIVRDAATGTVTVYVLDSPSPSRVLGGAPTILIPGREGATRAVALEPVPGRSNAWRVVNEDLRGTGAPRLRYRVGERVFETAVDLDAAPAPPAPPAVEPGNTTPAPGSPADQDAIPGDHDPGSQGEDRPPPPTAPPGDRDAIPGDADPGSDR